MSSGKSIQSQKSPLFREIRDRGVSLELSDQCFYLFDQTTKFGQINIFRNAAIAD